MFIRQVQVFLAVRLQSTCLLNKLVDCRDYIQISDISVFFLVKVGFLLSSQPTNVDRRRSCFMSLPKRNMKKPFRPSTPLSPSAKESIAPHRILLGSLIAIPPPQHRLPSSGAPPHSANNEVRLMRLLRRTRALRELQKLVTMMATCHPDVNQ